MKITLILFCFAVVIQTGLSKAENVVDTETILHDPFQKPESIKPVVSVKTTDQHTISPWTATLAMTLRAGGKFYGQC